MGPRAHSLFSARMGESSASYQSPSKDLQALNGRLQQQRHGFRSASMPFAVAGFDPAAAPRSLVLQTLDPNSVRAPLPCARVSGLPPACGFQLDLAPPRSAATLLWRQTRAAALQHLLWCLQSPMLGDPMPCQWALLEAGSCLEASCYLCNDQTTHCPIH